MISHLKKLGLLAHWGGVGSLAVLLALSLALAACQEDVGLPVCVEELVAAFDGLGEGPVAIRTLGGIRVEVIAGDAEGYHDGERWTLLALQGSTIGLASPCGARELEVVLDDTQVGLTLTAYEDPRSGIALGSARSAEALPVTEDPPYRRLTLTLPEGQACAYAELV
ncbi:MAG: hypothetical protein RBU30_10485, partial [Polyangia bacterium]|nr:hypothetical protein [Polyangia bacterium]